MRAKRILVVDDESSIRGILRALLEREGYEIAEAASGPEMWKCLSEGGVSLITLDLNLAGEDGLALAREIRGRMDLPIIMISGKADEIDRIVGLELGADDYIVKPFNLREVLARIRAVLRRYEPRVAVAGDPGERAGFGFDGWHVDIPSRRVLDRGGALVALTTAEFNLLAIFVERSKRVLSRDQLLDLLRGAEWSPYDRSVDTLVARLRKKIEDDPENPSMVKTVRGVGYVFAADVTRG
jgi:two-component system, OmpR family, response regulator